MSRKALYRTAVVALATPPSSPRPLIPPPRPTHMIKSRGTAALLAVFNGSDDELGIQRCLCSGRESEVLAQARSWRAKVAAARAEIRVESSSWKTLDADGAVSALVAFRFTQIDPTTGSVTFIRGSEHEWRFRAEQERGIGALRSWWGLRSALSWWIQFRNAS